MTNCAFEVLGPNKWPSEDYTTWNDPENSFADLNYPLPPLIIDHIFLQTKSPETIRARTSGFEVSKLKTACKPTSIEVTDQCPTFEKTLEELNLTQCIPDMPTEESFFTMHLKGAQRRSRANCDPENRISLSDHEAITATITIRKLGSNANKSETT